MRYNTFKITPNKMTFKRSIVKALMCFFMVTNYGFSQTLERTIIHDIPTDDVVYFDQVQTVQSTATTITAGTDELLTLTGTNFGEPNEVYFRNANFGGSAYSKAYQIESWTDNEIIVRVPSFAGSGDVRVLKTDGTLIQFDNIIVPYALINGNYQDVESRVAHVGQYVINLNLQEPARGRFIEAIEIVRCETKMNIILGDDTTQTTNANDGVNLVMFTDALPTYTLAATYNRFVGCIDNGQVIWYLKEFDILINENFLWNYDDVITSNEIDFLKVMVHELLHASMMGHVIDETDVMHFSTASGDNDIALINNNFEGRADQQTYSVTNEVCGQPIFTDSNCSTLGVDENFIDYTVKHIKVWNLKGMYVNTYKSIKDVPNGLWVIETTYTNGNSVNKKIIKK